MSAYVIIAGLLGLVVGNLLNWLIDRQARVDLTQPVAPRVPLSWLPVGGAIVQRNWLGLVVELLTALMTAALFAKHGFSSTFGVLWLAALVLIDTGAVDWRVKLIDVLLLLGATVVAVAAAPLHNLSWVRSLQGMGTALAIFLLLFIVAKILYPGTAAPFGLGDVYLGMFIGALVGFFSLSEALIYGMLLAGLVSIGLIVTLGYKRARHIPISYGAYLCLGVLFYLLRR